MMYGAVFVTGTDNGLISTSDILLANLVMVDWNVGLVNGNLSLQPESRDRSSVADEDETVGDRSGRSEMRIKMRFSSKRNISLWKMAACRRLLGLKRLEQRTDTCPDSSPIRPVSKMKRLEGL